MYQYKDSLLVLDSLDAAEYGRYFLTAFDEPNLSIAPRQKTVFRFIYESWLSHPIVINLTADQITVKQGISGWLYPDFNIDRLSAREQEQLRRAEWYFRTGYEKIKNPRWHSYFDSVFKLYPHLADIETYKRLHQRGEIPIRAKYQYAQKIIPISRQQYNSTVSAITASGFWRMPRESGCEYPPMDGAGFILEANTDTQYKIVSSPSCPDDYRKFTLACQDLVNLAGLEKQIKLIWDGGTISADSSTFVPEVPLEEVHR
jgi:hypothetical protein